MQPGAEHDTGERGGVVLLGEHHDPPVRAGADLTYASDRTVEHGDVQPEAGQLSREDGGEPFLLHCGPGEGHHVRGTGQVQVEARLPRVAQHDRYRTVVRGLVVRGKAAPGRAGVRRPDADQRDRHDVAVHLHLVVELCEAVLGGLLRVGRLTRVAYVADRYRGLDVSDVLRRAFHCVLFGGPGFQRARRARRPRLSARGRLRWTLRTFVCRRVAAVGQSRSGRRSVVPAPRNPVHHSGGDGRTDRAGRHRGSRDRRSGTATPPAPAEAATAALRESQGQRDEQHHQHQGADAHLHRPGTATTWGCYPDRRGLGRRGLRRGRRRRRADDRQRARVHPGALRVGG